MDNYLLFPWRAALWWRAWYFWGVIGTVASVLLSGIQNAQAEKLPLWELGLGAGALYQPYYIGTRQMRAFPFPVPMPVYRGDIFKSDEEGVRAELIDDKRISLDVSMDINPAIDSDDVDLRRGMNDIDNIFQIGPSLEVLLSDKGPDRWLLALPLRAQMQFTPERVRSAGYAFAPTLYRYRDMHLGEKLWTANVSLAANFLSDAAAAVYYDVDQGDAVRGRGQYEAEGGYAGYRFQAVMRSRDAQRLWVFFARYDNIDGARFDDSPLVEVRDGFSLGVIYSHILFRSSRLVDD